MLRRSVAHLRRGKPRAQTILLQEWLRGWPETHRPFQGGQPFFQDFLLRTADEEAKRVAVDPTASEESSAQRAASGSVAAKLAQSDYAERLRPVELSLQEEMEHLRALDGFQRQRGYNDLTWYDAQIRAKSDARSAVGMDEKTQQDLAPRAEGGDTNSASRPSDAGNGNGKASNYVAGDEEFQRQCGFSMLKKTALPVTTNYSQIDLWAEVPKYTREMYFLYLVARRRNFYAVFYDFEGKRVMPVYSAGNRGLKGGNRGIMGDGSAETAHQVTSQFLNDVIPKLRERDTQRGIKRQKIDIVVRILGFYNGRAGGMRAVGDRADVFNVRYVEDVTPYPLNGPKMPNRVRRNSDKV